jgi:hypothetical protein
MQAEPRTYEKASKPDKPTFTTFTPHLVSLQKQKLDSCEPPPTRTNAHHLPCNVRLAAAAAIVLGSVGLPNQPDKKSIERPEPAELASRSIGTRQT